MNKVLKVIFGIVFTFLFAFTGIGYAAFSQEFDVRGYIGLSELNAIYIVSVEQVEASQGSSVSNISFTNTLLTSNITLNNSDPNAYVTLEITIKNNTDNMEAGFNDFITSSNKIEYTSLPYSKSNPTGIHHMDTKLSPDEFRTFRVTIKYKDNTVSNVSNVKEVLNIDFIPWSVSGAIAVFKQLLNENFDLLDRTMNEVPTESYWFWERDTRDDSYISNAGGAADSDKEFVDGVFEGNTATFIPDPNTGELKETEMTIFIKRANLDGNTSTGDANGDEYILFMTADPLTSSGGQAIVFACVFTRFSQDQDYFMVGEMFEGKARIVSYDGGDGSGSFTTDRWYNTREYYDVAIGTGNENAQETCGNLGKVFVAALNANDYILP